MGAMLDRGDCMISTTLQDLPALVERSTTKRFLVDPEVEHAHVAPHPTRPIVFIVGVDLKQQSPPRSPLLMVCGLNLGHLNHAAATIHSGRSELTLAFHRPLLGYRVSQQPVRRVLGGSKRLSQFLVPRIFSEPRIFGNVAVKPLPVWQGVHRLERDSSKRIEALVRQIADSVCGWLRCFAHFELVDYRGILNAKARSVLRIKSPQSRLDVVPEPEHSGRWECARRIVWGGIGAVDLRDQCQAANVPFWMKQGGGYPNKRDKLEDMPVDLRIRELPYLKEQG